MINLRITILFVYNRYIIWSLLIEYQNPKQVLLCETHNITCHRVECVEKLQDKDEVV